MCVISSLLTHVSKEKSVVVADKTIPTPYSAIGKMLRELESQSFVVFYSLSSGPILCGL